MLARLAGTNLDAATVTVVTETGDSRVFRVAQSVQGGMAELRVGDPVIISFDTSRGDTVVLIQPASLRPGLAASIVLPAPLPTIRSGVLFHGATPTEAGVAAAMNARVVSVQPGDSRLIIRTAEGERVLTVAPSAAATLNELGRGDEIVIGLDAARDSVVSIERSAAPARAPAHPRGAVEEVAPPPSPAGTAAAQSGATAAAKPVPARRRTARRATARGTRPRATPAAAPTPAAPGGAASPMPTPRPVPTPTPR
jgi:hypothetical protein